MPDLHITIIYFMMQEKIKVFVIISVFMIQYEVLQ